MEYNQQNRPTKLYVDLKAIAHNVKEVQRILSPKTGIIAVIKASGYGSGSLNIVQTLIDNGINRFAVAIPEEAISLRNEGMTFPILVLTPPVKEDYSAFVEYNLTPAIADFETAAAIDRLCKDQGKILKIHIEIDTGMGRTGVLPEQAVKVISQINELKNLEIEAVFSHFSSAESDFEYTKNQITIFDAVVSELKNRGINIPERHICNSAGIVLFPEAHYEFVRPGLLLYGYFPDEILKGKINIKPSLSLKTRIIGIREVPEQTAISYNQTYITQGMSRIATLPIGYADGYRRELSNKGYVLIGEKKAPVVGRVCMDLLMVDVTGIPEAAAGDEVILFDNEVIPVEEIADICGTISYEIISTISNRVPKIYF